MNEVTKTKFHQSSSVQGPSIPFLLLSNSSSEGGGTLGTILISGGDTISIFEQKKQTINYKVFEISFRLNHFGEAYLNPFLHGERAGSVLLLKEY